MPGEGFPENRESSTTGYPVPAVLLKTPSASLRTDLVFFLATINLDPDAVEVIVLASCALHNYLRDECGNAYLCGMTDQDGQETWRQDPPLQQAALSRSTNARCEAKQNRERLMRYFNSEAGAVPWQWG